MNSIRINDSDLENWLKHKDYNPDKITLRRNYTDDFLICLENALKYKEKTEEITEHEYIDRLIVNLEGEMIEKKKYVIFKYYVKTNLNQGEKFGEFGFISEMRKRTASIITKENCHFITL